MPEVSENANIPTRKYEPTRNASNSVEIHMETSSHFTSTSQRNKLLTDITSGIMDTHIWNTAIGEKMKRLGSRIAVIDGLSPRTENKEWIWLSLPGNPSKISQTNEMFVVAGDTQDYKDLIDDLMKDSPNVQANEKSQELLGHYIAETDSIGQKLQAPNKIAMGLAVITMLGSAVETYRLRSKFTRRNVLELFAKESAAAAISIMTLKYLPKESVPVKLNDTIYDTIKRYLTNERTSTISLDGRTALFIQKSMDAAEYLHEQHVTVVAGNNHVHNKDNLLNNPDNRFQAIQAYARLLMNIIQDVGHKSGMLAEDVIREQQAVLDYLPKMKIFSVKGIKDSLKSKEVDSVLDKAITVKENNLESEFIRNALKDVIPGVPGK